MSRGDTAASQRRHAPGTGLQRLRSVRVVVALVAALVVTAGVAVPLAVSVSDAPASGSPTRGTGS